jgi:hypothetical protein
MTGARPCVKKRHACRTRELLVEVLHPLHKQTRRRCNVQQPTASYCNLTSLLSQRKQSGKSAEKLVVNSTAHAQRTAKE